MMGIHTNDEILGPDRERIRRLSDRLLFMRDQSRRDDLREHLRSEILEARRLRTAARREANPLTD
jgi:hypothetical protein